MTKLIITVVALTIGATALLGCRAEIDTDTQSGIALPR
jgi:hypothetical protein